MLSNYYYTVPDPLFFPFYMFMSIPRHHCPFYAPIATDFCRFCRTHLPYHRKYFVYSHKARIIQHKWFECRFRQFAKSVHGLYHIWITTEWVLLQKFRKIYYRKWNIIYWEQFLKRIQGNAFKK